VFAHGSMRKIELLPAVGGDPAREVGPAPASFKGKTLSLHPKGAQGLARKAPLDARCRAADAPHP